MIGEDKAGVEIFWADDKPSTVEEALRLLRFGVVSNPIPHEQHIDQYRTERRMLACADFFDRLEEGSAKAPSASACNDLVDEAQKCFELNRPLMMFLRSVPIGYQVHFDHHTFIPLKRYCEAAAWVIEQLSAKSPSARAMPDSEIVERAKWWALSANSVKEYPRDAFQAFRDEILRLVDIRKASDVD